MTLTKEQGQELKLMKTKYPKEVLNGHKVDLNADWKKAYVAMRVLAMINIDVTNKAIKAIELSGIQLEISGSMDIELVRQYYSEWMANRINAEQKARWGK
jgi:hypothetical protein